MTRQRYADALVEAIGRSGNCACVGIDPFMDLMPGSIMQADPASTLRSFASRVIDAVAGLVPVVKFQAACFERFGAAGYAELERGVGLARQRGLLVILDAKRGDIGSTSDHYAAGAVAMGASCITVNGYLGPSGIEPFLNAGLGVYVLVRTSNPDSDVLQSAPLADGRTVAGAMAQMVASIGASRLGSHGFSDVGAVVGATKADDAVMLRRVMPAQPFLVPGFGAQGGTLEDVARLRVDKPKGLGGILVNSSRGITYPKGSQELPASEWTARVRKAAEEFAVQMGDVC